MPLSRKSLAEIRARIVGDFELTGNNNAAVPGTLEFALANALAGESHAAHGVINYYAEQLFDISAEDEFLLRRAAPYGLALIAAVAATGTATFTGTNATVVTAGSELQASDGQLYTTDADGTIVAGTVDIAVTAVTLGVIGNQDAATVLTFTTPITNIDSTATVDGSGLTGGADQEKMSRFAERFGERKKTPPAGGNQNDYIAWAKQASVDISRVWVYSHENAARATVYGAVLVYIMADDLANPVPDAALKAVVQAYIDQPGVRPIGAKDVSVQAPTSKPLNLTFTALDANTTVVQQAIEAEIADLLKREAAPGGTVLLSHIREAISLAAGENDYTLTVPSADVTALSTEIAVPGTVTWP